VLVLGNSTWPAARLRIAHDVMRDAIDVEAVRSAASRAGYREEAVEFVQAFAKAEPIPSGRIRSDATRCSRTPTSTTRVMLARWSARARLVLRRSDDLRIGGAEHQRAVGGRANRRHHSRLESGSSSIE